jgi:hypothetical protein
VNSNERLAKAIQTGVPVPGTPEQARELVAQENEAAARAARTDAWLAKAREAAVVTNRCERADERRYGKPGPGRPGHAVFDRVDGLMTPAAKAQTWARIELGEIDQDGDAYRLATELERIAQGLRGEMPSDVHIGSRRGCCGATLIENETEDGTDFECPLCGKEVMP